MRHRVRLMLGAILVVALALRVGFVLEQRPDVLFEHPVLDEKEYVDAARALAAGESRDVDDRPYWQPPGIIYALAATMTLAGPGLTAPRIVQVLISVASCWLVFAIGRRLFDARVGLGAAAILAVHGVLIFETYELLPATWIVFFDLLALWLLLRALDQRTVVRALVAGVGFGVSAVFAPTILPFVAIAAVLVKRPRAIAALVVGVALPIVPVTARNYAHGHELVLVSSNGGLNLYIGNNAAYRETLSVRPGRHWQELTEEPGRAGITRPGEASTYFQRKAIAFYLDEPARALALVARKLYLVFNGAEIPRDTDLYAARAHSRILTAVVWPDPLRFPDGLLIPAALLGIAATWRDRRRLVVPLAFVAVAAVVVVAFFVTSRHRAPALPMVALFAAAGIGPIAGRWRGWDPVRRAGAAAAAAALVVVLNLPTWETRTSYAAELDFYRGLAARELHHTGEAVVAFRSAIDADPTDPRAWFELGNTLPDGDAAIDAWTHAAALDPWDSRARRRISMALVRRGDLDGAIAVLQASIDAHLRDDAHYASDHLSLAFLRVGRGQTTAAIAHLRAAARGDPAFVRRNLHDLARAARDGPGAIHDDAFVRALADLEQAPAR